MALRTSVVPRADRPPVIPPSLRRDAARDVATPVRPQGAADEPPAKRAKRRRSAAEKLLARAELEAKSRSTEVEAPQWPEAALLGQELFTKALEASKGFQVAPPVGRQAALHLASMTGSTLRLAWSLGLLDSSPDWQGLFEEKLFEALQVSNLGFLSPDLQRQWRKPKASVWQRLQHLASLDRLLLGLWAEEHAVPHPCELSELAVEQFLQDPSTADHIAQLFQSPAAADAARRLGLAPSRAKKTARSQRPCWALRWLRARWLEGACLVKAEGCSRKQMLRYVTHWQLVGRDVTARYLAFVIPSPKVLREIQKRCGSGGLVELGAGMGYWSHLLANSGVEVVALDVDPPEKSRFKVQLGDASSLPKLQRELLLLCMPPPGEAACADEALRHFTGRYVVYIGEWYSGMTATRSFHESLWANYDLELRLPLPCYPMLRLECFIFRVRSVKTTKRARKKEAEEVTTEANWLLTCDHCSFCGPLRCCPTTRYWRLCSESCYEAMKAEQEAFLKLQNCGLEPEVPRWDWWEEQAWIDDTSTKQWAKLKRATPQSEIEGWRTKSHLAMTTWPQPLKLALSQEVVPSRSSGRQEVVFVKFWCLQNVWDRLVVWDVCFDQSICNRLEWLSSNHILGFDT
ncbi:unnamed protein product [Durusdinium trenchii]|uniref:Uncharacterized protein n=1 Tax=Durusdinium trenchii TaxID=1381693 RepID=A0ABP0MAQ4_9DINO